VSLLDEPWSWERFAGQRGEVGGERSTVSVSEVVRCKIDEHYNRT
jgi:hypothetical protein